MATKKSLTGRELLLQMRLAELEQLSISKETKDRIAGIVKANADSSQGEGLDFALKHISKQRLAIVTETAKQMHAIGRTVTKRGRAKLSALSEEEWQSLVDKANE